MRVLILGDSFTTQGGMNQATGQGLDPWITTTPGASNAIIAGVVTGNGFNSGGFVSAEWGSLSPDDNQGMIPALFRDSLIAGLSTSDNVHLGRAGDNWLNQEASLDNYIASNPNERFDAVVINLGTNTAVPLTAQGVYGPQFDSLMAKIRQNYPESFVVHSGCVTTNNDTSLTPVGTYEAKVDEINTFLAAKATQYPYLYFSDTFTAIGGHTIIAANWQPADNVHPNSTGSNIIGAQLATDFVTAQADFEANMAIFGKDGSAAPTPTLFESLNSGSSRQSMTFDSNIAAGLTLTAIGDEKITKGLVWLDNQSGSDVTARMSIYSTSIDGGVRNSPESEARLAVSSTILIPLAASSMNIYEFTFPTPYEPTAGEIIIGAVSIASGILNVGVASATGAFAYIDVADSPATWTGGNGTAITDDPYVWFETDPTQRPTLVAPYTNQTVTLGDTLNINISSAWSGAASFQVNGLTYLLEDVNDAIVGMVIDSGVRNFSIVAINEFGASTDSFYLQVISGLPNKING